MFAGCITMGHGWGISKITKIQNFKWQTYEIISKLNETKLQNINRFQNRKTHY